MPIKVEFVRPAFAMCDDPRTGKVIIRVQFSGVTEPVSDRDLGPHCAAFAHDFQLTRDHEPHFVLLIARKLEGDAANRIANIFHGRYIKPKVSGSIVTEEVQYYDEPG